MHVATRLCGTSASVYEYKRSGQRVRAAACQQISHELCDQWLSQWAQEWLTEIESHAQLGAMERWRILAMKVLLADMAREEMILPTKDAVKMVLASSSASTWDRIHLNAQYQAVYYSLRMLKQVLTFVTQAKQNETGNAESLEQALRVLDSLPGIAAFCDREMDDCGSSSTDWADAAEQVLNDFGILDQPKSNAIPPKHGNERRKKRKIKQTQNAFSSLEDVEEA